MNRNRLTLLAILVISTSVPFYLYHTLSFRTPTLPLASSGVGTGQPRAYLQGVPAPTATCRSTRVGFNPWPKNGDYLSARDAGRALSHVDRESDITLPQIESCGGVMIASHHPGSVNSFPLLLFFSFPKDLFLVIALFPALLSNSPPVLKKCLCAHGRRGP